MALRHSPSGGLAPKLRHEQTLDEFGVHVVTTVLRVKRAFYGLAGAASFEVAFGAFVVDSVARRVARTGVLARVEASGPRRTDVLAVRAQP